MFWSTCFKENLFSKDSAGRRRRSELSTSPSFAANRSCSLLLVQSKRHFYDRKRPGFHLRVQNWPATLRQVIRAPEHTLGRPLTCKTVCFATTTNLSCKIMRLFLWHVEIKQWLWSLLHLQTKQVQFLLLPSSKSASMVRPNVPVCLNVCLSVQLWGYTTSGGLNYFSSPLWAGRCGAEVTCRVYRSNHTVQVSALSASSKGWTWRRGWRVGSDPEGGDLLWWGHQLQKTGHWFTFFRRHFGDFLLVWCTTPPKDQVIVLLPPRSSRIWIPASHFCSHFQG